MGHAAATQEELNEAWWASSEVQQAKARSKFDHTGDLADLMENLLAVVDEREAEATALPEYPPSLCFKQAAENFAEGRRFGVEALPTITQMLDLGAEPDRLKAVFPEHLVDRAVSTWHPWREAALTAARAGASPEDVRCAVTAATTGHGHGKTWPQIVIMLNAHGFTYSVEDAPVTFPDKAQARLEVMQLFQQGLSYSKIANRTGLSRTNVNAIIRRVRSGFYAELQNYLETAS